METSKENSILVMFPESKRFQGPESSEAAHDLIAEMLRGPVENYSAEEDDEDCLTPAPKAPLYSNLTIEAGSVEAFEHQMKGLTEALQRMNYYLQEIEQFLPEKSTRRGK